VRTARSRRRWVILSLVGVLLLAGLSGLVWSEWQQARWNRFDTVSEGVLYRSGRLEPDVLAEAVSRHGLRTVVDLTPATGEDARLHEEERKVLAEAGVRYVEMPIPGKDSPTPEQVKAWRALLADEGSRPILVHCKHGVHRTGQMVAAYEMEYLGKSPGQALEDAPLHGHRLKPSMRDFILRYRFPAPLSATGAETEEE
jgi:protein tyrosine/serine phosphatase